MQTLLTTVDCERDAIGEMPGQLSCNQRSGFAKPSL
jgi:hypothetical protein